MDISGGFRFFSWSDEGYGDEHGDREGGEDDGDRVGTGEVEALVALLHAKGRRLRLALESPRHDRDGAVLAEAAGCRQDDAVDHRPADGWEGDLPERLPVRRTQCPRGLLLVVADLPECRYDLACDERERDEDRRDDHRRQREEELDVVV